MQMKKVNDKIVRTMCELGEDVLSSEEMQGMRRYVQHGAITRYEHCLSVCYHAVLLARGLKLHVDERSMIRGALLHDFFLYDWHDRSAGRRLHGFTHAREALETAEKFFDLNACEREVILRHMFPLNITPPGCREALIVSLADKYSALLETLHLRGAEQVFHALGMVKGAKRA